MRRPDAGIGLSIKLATLATLIQVASDHVIVSSFDLELLPIAGPLAQFISLAHASCRQKTFAEVGIGEAHDYMSHGEIRVELDGPLKKGNAPGTVASPDNEFVAQSESLECLKRCCGALLKRRIEFPHRAQRFSEFATHFARRLAQGIEDVVLV